MGWSFDPSAWSDGVTIPHVADFQHIASDMHTRGATVDGGGYGRANTGFITLLPGALPGTVYNVTAASWAGGVATLTIGGHALQVNQLVTVSGITPSGYNGTVTVTAITGTTASFALASNPGTYVSGGTVLAGGAVPGYGTVAIDQNLNVKVWNGSSYVAATTAVAAGVWWSGSGAPSSGLGSNGDMYIDTATENVYGPKAGGSWGSAVTNIKGATGAGAVWWSGAGAPSSGLGNNGDMYLNTSTGDVYGPKTAGAWGGIVKNIVGPSGGMADPGANGIVKRTALNTTAAAVAGTDYFAPDASGNLGLGVTPPAFGSGDNGIAFPGGNLQGNPSTGGLYLLGNAYYTGSGYNYASTNVATAYFSSSGQHRFYVAPSGTAGTAITWTTAVTISNSGQVGIGTSPSYQLHLSTDSAAKPSTSTWTVASDARLKQNVQTVTDDSLGLICNLRVVRAQYNGLGGMPAGLPLIGLVAQEARIHVPEMVSIFNAPLNPTDSEDTELFGLNYHALLLHCAHALQQIQARLVAKGI